jgi:DNA-binding transcriptional regulator GbsR (MarR family)
LSERSETRLELEVRQFIEDMGLFYEEQGFPPMAGRLAGWLLICDPPHQTAGELAEVLEASAGSISSMTRLLTQCGLVERVAVPGQRGAAFRHRTGASTELLTRALERSERACDLFERGLSLLGDHPPETRRRLRDQLEFHRFIRRELPALMERWEKEHRE